MAQTILSRLPQWLAHFDTLESTNNYAMHLIDDGMAQHGQGIWADFQSKGKGQRGNTWLDHAGNLKFSLIVTPAKHLQTPFQLSMLVAATLARYLKIILPEACQIAVKWPNDIYINDKKACGLLIENVFRGAQWSFAVIGIGLNVNQTDFPEELQHKATSLSFASGGRLFDLLEIITDLRHGILNRFLSPDSLSAAQLLEDYNRLLYRKDALVMFRERQSGRTFEAVVEGVQEDGRLLLRLSEGLQLFGYGSLEWLLHQDLG